MKKKLAKKGGPRKAAVGGGKAPAEEEEPEGNEDWLGEDDGDELGGALAKDSDDEDDDDDLTGDDEDDDDDGGPGSDVDDDQALVPADEGSGPQHRSRFLAKVEAGEQAPDLNTIKQQIHDDAALLKNWRKARQLGDKRSREEVVSRLTSNCSTYFGYSEELASYFISMFSAEAAVEFFEANEKQRPFTIRTNSLKARRSSLMQALIARKVQVDPVGAWTKVGLKVYESAVPIGATPEYLGGQYMIQSASSFIPVMALAPQQNEVVLDMAAAPGGKTTHIGQLMRNTGTLFANDLRRERCKALVANVHRLGLTNVIVTNLDGKKLKGMLPKLDRVLLDAPCTGSGIVARDPSVKVKRGLKDFEEHSKLQKELLCCAIDMVDANSKTGGYIVYSTCSVSVEEDEAVVDHILKVRNVEVVSFNSAVNFGVEGMTKYREKRFHPSLAHSRRYYPHVHNMDGFFVCKLKKTSNDIPERVKKDRSKGADHVKVWGEEHWTPEMMNTVMDFPPPGEKTKGAASSPSAGAAGKLNKRERKKIKRAEKLAARAAAANTAALAAANAARVAEASSATTQAKEPEEEPGTKASALRKKKKRAAPEEAAAEDAAAEPAEGKKVKKKRKKSA